MYSDDTPQQRAAKASGESRRRNAAERRARDARHAWLRAHPGAPGHPFACVCDECLAARGGEMPPSAEVA